MPKTVTLRLKDDVYALFQAMAEQDNRPLSNLFETAALRFIENETVGEFVGRLRLGWRGSPRYEHRARFCCHRKVCGR